MLEILLNLHLSSGAFSGDSQIETMRTVNRYIVLSTARMVIWNVVLGELSWHFISLMCWIGYSDSQNTLRQIVHFEFEVFNLGKENRLVSGRINLQCRIESVSSFGGRA